MIDDRDPRFFMYDLLNTYGDRLSLSFSRYRYRPQSVIDEREVFSVPGEFMQDKWVGDQIESLPAGWELALNSNVKDHRNRKHHIPMIDFCGKNYDVFFDGYFRDIVGKKLIDKMYVYDSGRSFHAYFLTLFNTQDWINFMGRLLLLNLPGRPDVVDARWIGHRLCSGYSALRWSCNSSKYLRSPRYLTTDELWSAIKGGVAN
jgi:hypothetical protein